MNRLTKISAWLAIGLFITAGLALFPAAAAAQTLDISIESETGGSPLGSLCSPILPETGRVLRPRTSTGAIP